MGEVVEAAGAGAEWVKRLASKLKELGVEHEYEGEALRLHIGELVVEVTTHPEGGYMVSMQVPLPGSSGDQPDHYVNAFANAVRLFLRLSGSPEYQLDTSLPDYPMLYIVRRYDDPWKMVDEVAKAVRDLKG
jgi:hypothetical protein